MENKQQRVFIYAFLSRIFTDVLDKQFIMDLSQNEDMLNMIGNETSKWFKFTELEQIEEDLNVDFSSMFLLHTQPIESFVLDAKHEVLVGLQNPVMSFYFQNGFEVDMNQTQIIAPDHLGIELGFMQTAVFRDEVKAQKEFLEQHLLKWVIPYLLGMKSMAITPFYKDVFDFTVEFLSSDYHNLKKV
jgi:TorA maturation chaperone TorD